MSPNNKVVYVGVTNDLMKRIRQHRNKLIDGFTKKYNVTKLVHYEEFKDPISAIEREKQLKGGSRQKKLDLVRNKNPHYDDLYEETIG